MATIRNESGQLPIRPRHAIAEFTAVLWQLRSILIFLSVLFVLLSLAMYYVGGPVDAGRRSPASLGGTLYFCAITSLTIGFGDVVPTTPLGRFLAVALGALGVLAMGVMTAAAVQAIQAAARRTLG
ncbi:voltage-gated potassium channel [Cupriavidus sp. OV038]|uniref:potassium channel family protein n=1 Tax=unclassified Cupriavidus TaxID=2640874 RepID=UPI0008DF0F19|nr:MULTISPECIES: potassium channel family protein [unclassified Cupriavidus]SFC58340.1 voltage-gated potassium channel [Cupriavidus sp. OV038]SFP44574.1 voltage-gated potassium channel [Cupriavidus sp. OV096]